MSLKTANVTGKVYAADSDHHPVPAATVVLVPQEKHCKNDVFAYLTTMADEAGRFAIRDVGPGEYRVFAWEGAYLLPNFYMDPDFITPLENRAVAVTLGEGDHAIIKVTLITDR
jgi:hypothetical protein